MGRSHGEHTAALGRLTGEMGVARFKFIGDLKEENRLLLKRKNRILGKSTGPTSHFYPLSARLRQDAKIHSTHEKIDKAVFIMHKLPTKIGVLMKIEPAV